MNLENLVSQMMSINVKARLWHWSTDIAQHHVTFEQFLTQNEVSTDSLVESILGNDKELNFSQVGVEGANGGSYSLENARKDLISYRENVFSFKKKLEELNDSTSGELVAILDDVTEQTSKALYLLKLK